MKTKIFVSIFFTFLLIFFSPGSELPKKCGYLVHYSKYSVKKIKHYSFEYDTLYITGYSIINNGSVKIVSPNFHNLCKKLIPAKKFTPVITFKSSKNGSRILNSRKLIQQLVSSISCFLKTNSFKTVQLDFEHLPPSDVNGYKMFLNDLRKQNTDLHVSVCLFPQVKWIDNYSKFTEISVLAESADEFMLMSYDQHGKNTKEGPITSLSWTEDNIIHIVKYITPEKLVLGVPLYGYAWNKHAKIRVITERYFYRRFKSKEIVHHKEGVSILDNPEIHGLSYVSVGDSNTKEQFLQLAKKYNLGGTAVWRLGFEK